VSLIGFAVGGAFLSLSYFDLPYNIMMLVVLTKKWISDKAWENETSIAGETGRQPKQGFWSRIILQK
jgi:putative inorganic carbon (hco3(-)) transporter